MQMRTLQDNKYPLLIIKYDEKIEYLSQKVAKVWTLAMIWIKYCGLVSPSLLLPLHRCGPKKQGKSLCNGTDSSTETQGSFMSVVHPFLLVVLEISMYDEGRDYKVEAWSNGSMHLKQKWDSLFLLV